MKPIYQNHRFGCLAACLASVLEVDLSSVPEIRVEELEDFPAYGERLQKELLAPLGLGLVECAPGATPPGLSIAVCHVSSPTEPAPLVHAVVADCGVLVHDPTPSQAQRERNLHARPLYFLALTTLDAARFVGLWKVRRWDGSGPEVEEVPDGGEVEDE